MISTSPCDKLPHLAPMDLESAPDVPKPASFENKTSDSHSEMKDDAVSSVELQNQHVEDEAARVYLQGSQFWLVSAS